MYISVLNKDQIKKIIPSDGIIDISYMYEKTTGEYNDTCSIIITYTNLVKLTLTWNTLDINLTRNINPSTGEVMSIQKTLLTSLNSAIENSIGSIEVIPVTINIGADIAPISSLTYE